MRKLLDEAENTEKGLILPEEEYDKHWVAIQGVEDRTFHSFHRVNVFKSNAFDNLEQKEKCFTAAHVHLPESLGKEGSKEGSLATNVSRLLQGLIDATTKTSLTLKVTLLLSLCILCLVVLNGNIAILDENGKLSINECILQIIAIET